MGLGITGQAKAKDVTKKYRSKVTSMLNELDGYLCYDIAFDKASTKFVFNDYTKTSIMLYRNYGYVYNRGESYMKSRTKKDMKTFFGSSAKFKVKKYNGRSYKLPYLFKMKNGKIIYLGGEYGDSFPQGKVTKIVQTSSKKFTVTYKEYLKYWFYSTTLYRGTYQINLKKANNKYGFIITNIKRTDVWG